ncbi:hypothetical protein M404DRAFT_1008116 [Pisolithus tinctorius Marx 270]|uniref:Uncharacterized protein n=1 Tax=Pisolithus tinctorius Marx 270 TaxID=870435 RepID=A0A0C3N0U0_PISTI|nr:hypothetical protein M404DRAFT_1008425 [Pisolithus tinctorius Marx 270]KIN94729.1 hypothetical protein M404DRAFT_1008116 [Pisolithus tinctorius Marx 270]
MLEKSSTITSTQLVELRQHLTACFICKPWTCRLPLHIQQSAAGPYMQVHSSSVSSSYVARRGRLNNRDRDRTYDSLSQKRLSPIHVISLRQLTIMTASTSMMHPAPATIASTRAKRVAFG